MMQYSAPAMIVNEATNCHDSGSNGLRIVWEVGQCSGEF